MAKMYPYLAFENAKEALGYYEEVFEQRIFQGFQ